MFCHHDAQSTTTPSNDPERTPALREGYCFTTVWAVSNSKATAWHFLLYKPGLSPPS